MGDWLFVFIICTCTVYIVGCIWPWRHGNCCIGMRSVVSCWGGVASVGSISVVSCVASFENNSSTSYYRIYRLPCLDMFIVWEANGGNLDWCWCQLVLMPLIWEQSFLVGDGHFQWWSFFRRLSGRTFRTLKFSSMYRRSVTDKYLGQFPNVRTSS